MTVSPPQDFERRRTRLICLLLGLVTVVVYGRVGGFEFTNYDEPNYIYQNPIVSAGLTLRGLWWGLTTSYFDFWHPVTWWSHMLDVELFGLRPGWHHLVNVAFHVANTLLLFVVLRRMTGAVWRSAMVAALFALHPLHVESVAWLAERKDVLSGLFFMLTLLAYVNYARARGGDQYSVFSVQCSEARRWYALALLFFALGLMSKAMVVTLPFVLLLLDYWPLGRLRSEVTVGRPGEELKTEYWKLNTLLLEKVPFFVLAAVSSAITYAGMRVAQQHAYSASATPWGLRLANAAVSYVRYLGKLIWPTDLAVVYPLPERWPGWQVGGAVAVLVMISSVVFIRRRSAPYLVFGWLMFLGTLVPVIGLVAMSYAALADRYTYIPAIGLFVAVVWAVAEKGEGGADHGQRTTMAISFAALVIYATLTWVQVGHWRNSLTLWTHCVSVTRGNPAAHYNLAHVLADGGQTLEAMEQYGAAIAAKPDYLEAHLNLGSLLAESGRKREATNCFANALRLNPEHALAQRNMGVTLLDLGEIKGAVYHCSEAVRLNPSDFVAYAGLGRGLSAEGQSDEAVRRYGESLSLNPQFVEAHYYLGLEFLKRGQFEAAATSLATAARLAPAREDIRAQLEAALKRKGQ